MTTPPTLEELRRLYDEAAAEDRERVDKVLAKEPVERRLLANPRLVKFLQDRSIVRASK